MCVEFPVEYRTFMGHRTNHALFFFSDVEEGVLYHPGSQQIHLLKNSGSVDSFSSGSTSSSASLQNHSSSSPTCPTPTGHTQIVDMHQVISVSMTPYTVPNYRLYVINVV